MFISFEFKRDKSAEEAIKQIEDMGYAKPYAADKRTILKIGVNFDSKDRCLSGWEVKFTSQKCIIKTHR